MAGKPATRRKVGRPTMAERQTDTAEDLKSVALDLFAANGYGQVSIKEIGLAAGVNTAMIYYYFSDKEGLCRAAIEDAAAQVFQAFQEAIDQVRDPKEKIHCWLDTHVQFMSTIRKMVKVSLDLRTDTSGRVEVDKAIGHFYELEKDTLVAFIELGTRNGAFRAVDANDVRRVISTFLDGAMIRSMIRPNFELKQTVDSFQEFLWHYLETKPQ